MEVFPTISHRIQYTHTYTYYPVDTNAYRHQRRVLIVGVRVRAAAIVPIRSWLGEAHFCRGPLMVGQMMVIDDGLHLRTKTHWVKNYLFAGHCGGREGGSVPKKVHLAITRKQKSFIEQHTHTHKTRIKCRRNSECFGASSL